MDAKLLTFLYWGKFPIWLMLEAEPEIKLDVWTLLRDHAFRTKVGRRLPGIN